MKRTLLLGVAVVFGWLGVASTSEAQVFVRAPFVRVAVGNGVYVRAPFVNLYVPPAGPVYGPRVIYMPPPVIVQPPAPAFAPQPQPVPAPNAPPQPVQPSSQPLTIDAFAKSFQAKAGSYDTTIVNPLNNQPTAVRFTLPEGTPRRVLATRDSIEFIYGLRQWVRIEFERDGVRVTSRN